MGGGVADKKWNVPTGPQKRGGYKKVVTLPRFSDKKRTKFSNFFVVRIDYQSGHNVGYQEKLSSRT